MIFCIAKNFRLRPTNCDKNWKCEMKYFDPVAHPRGEYLYTLEETLVSPLRKYRSKPKFIST